MMAGRALDDNGWRVYPTRMTSAYSAPASPPAAKRSLNLTIDGRLIDEARELGLPLSALFEETLRERVQIARAGRWLAENRAAIEAYNARIERDGMFGDDLRMF